MPRPEGFEAFLSSVRAQIRVGRAREEVTRELETHLEEQRDAYVKGGLSEDEAAVKAVEQMGDPVLIGGQLDRLHRPRPDWPALALVALLVLVGGAIQLCMSGPDRPFPFISAAFARYLFYAPIGIAVLAIVYFADYSILGRFPIGFYAAAVLAGFCILMVSPSRNGSVPVDYYWGFVLLPVYSGVISSRRGRRYGGLALCGALYLPMALICLLANLITLFVFFTVFGALLLTVAVLKGWFRVNKPLALTLICAPCLLALGAIYFTSPRFMTRLMAALNPSLDPLGDGYQSHVVHTLLSHAKIIGAASWPDALHNLFPNRTEFAAAPILERILPAWNTDNALTYLIIRFGWLAGLAVLLPLGLLIWRMFAAVRRQKSALGFMVSLSAALAVAWQTLVYVIGNLGFPLFNMTLPLLSYGGVGFVVNMALVGLMLSAFRSHTWMTDRQVGERRPRKRLRVSLKWECTQSDAS